MSLFFIEARFGIQIRLVVKTASKDHPIICGVSEKARFQVQNSIDLLDNTLSMWMFLWMVDTAK